MGAIPGPDLAFAIKADEVVLTLRTPDECALRKPKTKLREGRELAVLHNARERNRPPLNPAAAPTGVSRPRRPAANT